MPQNSWLTKYLGKAKILVAFLFIFSLILGGFSLGFSSTLVKTIKIENAPPSLQISGLGEIKGKNILLLDDDNVAGSIKEKNPNIKSVQVKKNYPSTVSLSLKFYDVQAELNVGTGYFLLSEDGRILSKSKKRATEKTIINFYQKLNYYSYSSGDYLNINDIEEAIYYIKLLSDLGIAVDNLDIKDRDMLLCNVGKKSIVFTTSKSREQQTYEISQIIKGFKINGTDYGSIDLRFEKPIIKF